MRNESRGILSRGQRTGKKKKRRRRKKKKRKGRKDKEEEEKIEGEDKREGGKRATGTKAMRIRAYAQNLISSSLAHLGMASPFTVAEKHARVSGNSESAI